MAKEKKFYVGKKEVQAINVANKYDMVGVLYNNGFNEDFTKAQWEDVRSEKPYEEGEIMIRKHDKLISRIIKDMMASRIKMSEQAFVLEKASASIVNNAELAIAKSLGVEHKDDLMLAQIDAILKETSLKDENKKNK